MGEFNCYLRWSETRLLAANQQWTAALQQYQSLVEKVGKLKLRWLQRRILGEWANALEKSNEPDDTRLAGDIFQQVLAIFTEFKSIPYAAML